MTTIPQRALGAQHCFECELATSDPKTCICRCGGVLHGASRVSKETGVAGLQALPAGDPHHVSTSQEKRERRREQRRARKHARWEKQKRAFFAARAARQSAPLSAREGSTS